jgi:hypothetical protein
MERKKTPYSPLIFCVAPLRYQERRKKKRWGAKGAL